MNLNEHRDNEASDPYSFHICYFHDVQAIKQIVEQLPDTQTENMKKIREAMEDCSTDSTEDLGEKIETEMSEMRKKIDEEISAAKDLLAAYRTITDQDAAQIQAILEDQYG